MILRQGKRRRHGFRLGIGLTALLCAAGATAANTPIDELRVKRQGIFAFDEPPAVTRKGDTVTVRFVSRAFCDATVAVEDARGRIVRHLASGVLGPNAPEPFQPDSLAQTVVWDGKNDRGEYLDHVDGLVLRVSLGLNPVFERRLLSTAYRRIQREPPLIHAAEDGVYVYQGRVADHVRMFDRQGRYVRTVYPFPARHLESFDDLRWQAFPPDGRRWPLKEGFHQATLLRSGDNAGFERYGVDRHGTDRLFPESRAATFLAVHAPPVRTVPAFVALGKLTLHRFATEGAAGDFSLDGPAATVPAPGADAEAPSLFARRAAISPDGSFLYLAAFRLPAPNADGGDTASTQPGWLPAVYRMDLNRDEAPTPFLPVPTATGAPLPEAALRAPVSVACDSAGRVYVADYEQNRIAIFDSDGNWLRNLAADRPAQVMAHRQSGVVYVLSALAYPAGETKPGSLVPCRLLEFAPLDKGGGLRATYDFPPEFAVRADPHDRGSGLPWFIELDSWSNPPVFWIAREWAPQDRWGWREDYERHNIRLLALEDGALRAVRDFADEVRREALREASPRLFRRRLHVNPVNGRLFVAEGDSGAGKSFRELLEIDPETGAVRAVPLPFDAEDMTFDKDGFAYLRTDRLVVRYRSRNWQEIPWDYGVERDSVSDAGDRTGRQASVISGLPIPSRGFWHHGGLSVSAQGNLLVSCYVSPRSAPGWGPDTGAQEKLYEPTLFPGRAYGPRAAVLHIFNRHGHRRHEDVVPGLGVVHGVGLDARNNVYVLASATRLYDGRPYPNPATGTLMKFRPGKGRILGEGPSVPEPLDARARPKRPPDIRNSVGGPSWVEGAEWLYGGVGFAGDLAGGASRCSCANMRFALDDYGRSFVPETSRFSVGVLDTNGNLILRLGRYGNADDGQPAEPDPASDGPARHALGGDEIALFHPSYLATHADRRLFIADGGNDHIVAVRLAYHAEASVRLGDIPDSAAK